MDSIQQSQQTQQTQQIQIAQNLELMTQEQQLNALDITIPQQVNNMMAYHLMLARKYTNGYKALGYSEEIRHQYYTGKFNKESSFFKENGSGKTTHEYHPYDDSPVTETLLSASVIYGRSLLNFFRIYLPAGASKIKIGAYQHRKSGNDLFIDDVLGDDYPDQSAINNIFKCDLVNSNKPLLKEFLKFANRFTAHITTEFVGLPAPGDQEFINHATLEVYHLFKKFIAPYHPKKSEEEYLRKIWYYDQIESQGR